MVVFAFPAHGCIAKKNEEVREIRKYCRVITKWMDSFVDFFLLGSTSCPRGSFFFFIRFGGLASEVELYLLLAVFCCSLLVPCKRYR